jgi:hypothetical protein
MLTEKRKYSLEIWALGLGFYVFYTPYSGLTKALSSGLLAGTNGRDDGIHHGDALVEVCRAP